MAATTAQRSSSALNKIRRELKARTKAVSVATGGGVAKRSSASPPPLSSVSTGGATVKVKLVDSTKADVAKNCSGQPLATATAPKKIDYLPMGEVTQRRTTAPPRRDPIVPTALIRNKSAAPPPSPPCPLDSSSTTTMTRPPCSDPRKKLTGMTKGGIVKKSSSALPPQQRPASIQKPSAPMPQEPAGPASKKRSLAMQYEPAGPATKKPSLEMPQARAGPATKKTPSAALIPPRTVSVKKGMTVKVRTHVGTLPTGQGLVLWLGARVVSVADADDGYLQVMYHGDFPRDDPFRTVRVAVEDVKNMPAVAEA